MKQLSYNNLTIVYKLDKNNIKIIDSYKVTNKSDMINILKKLVTIAEQQGITYSRSINSWVHEWRAHNLLYKFNYKRASTQSVDLNEDESGLRVFLYHILSLFYMIK